MAKISIIPWIVKKLKRCIGIVEDTDTASQAIASNKYVIWKGDVCKSTSAISEGDTLSSSNLSAVNGGVGNDLSQAIANLKGWENIDVAYSSKITGTSGTEIVVNKELRLVSISLHAVLGTALSSGDNVLSIDARYAPKQHLISQIFNGNNTTFAPIVLAPDATMKVYSSLPAPINIYCNLVWKY